MKLLHCSDCHGAFSIGPFLGVCPCGHSAGKQVQGTLAVVVTGPARIYALRNKDLALGKGKFWRIGATSKDVYKAGTLKEIQSKADEVGKGMRRPLTRRK